MKKEKFDIIGKHFWYGLTISSNDGIYYRFRMSILNVSTKFSMFSNSTLVVVSSLTLAVVVSIPVSPLFARLFDSDNLRFVVDGGGSKM